MKRTLILIVVLFSACGSEPVDCSKLKCPAGQVGVEKISGAASGVAFMMYTTCVCQAVAKPNSAHQEVIEER